MTKSQEDKIPQHIIRRFQTEAPVDIKALAEKLGIKVWASKKLPEGISGKLFKDPKHGGSEGYSILVNSAEPYIRKRFTVAHEIGHFILHRDDFGESLMDNEWYRSGLRIRAEADANRVAANILMPEHLIRRYILLGLNDEQTLAKKFEVSVAAMRMRLDEIARQTPVPMPA